MARNARAHHGSSADLGQSLSGSAPIVDGKGDIASASTRLMLDQSLYSISQNPSFDNPLSERSTWWRLQLAAFVALGDTLELGAALPFAFRFTEQDAETDNYGLGDLRLQGRYFLPAIFGGNHNLSLGTEVSLPTGRDEDGFSAHRILQHLAVSWRAIETHTRMLWGLDSGILWSYESQPQMVMDYRTLIGTPQYLRTRFILALSLQHYLSDSNAALQSLPSQRREAGDLLFSLSPSVAIFPAEQFVLALGSDIPLGPNQNVDWTVHLSVQYWATFVK